MYVQHEMSPSCTKDSTINFLNVESGDNRSLKMRGPVSAVIPVAGHSNKLVALIERAICFVDKETGDELELAHTCACTYLKSYFSSVLRNADLITQSASERAPHWEINVCM